MCDSAATRKFHARVSTSDIKRYTVASVQCFNATNADIGDRREGRCCGDGGPLAPAAALKHEQSNRHCDLPEVRSPLHVPEGFRSLRQREGLIDYRPQTMLLDRAIHRLEACA